MKPSCDTVEYARTFLISHCLSAIVAASSAVAAPITQIVSPETGESANRAELRTTRYTPAVTIVAAWIRAETGVGPAIASGSQVWSRNCADLPIAPMNSSRQVTVI